MKIAIMGTGGIGGYFGGRLAQAGNDVTFIARGAQLDAIQTKGLKVNSINGDFLVCPVQATENIQSLGKVDLVLVTVKAWQVREVAREMKPVIHNETVVLPLQNGVLAAEEITGELGKERVMGGLCRIFCKVIAPGVIEHSGIEPTIILGELDNQKTTRAEILERLFNEAGIHSFIASDIHAELWKKFISICVSGFLAVTRSPYGVVRELPETRGMIYELLSEIYEVSKKVGINLPDDLVDKLLAAIDTFPYDATSSLTRDVMEGKPSEIEYQNGTVVRFGKKYHVDTPVNQFIYHCILPMELKARKKI